MSRRTILFIRWGVFILACGFLYVRLARHSDPAAFTELLAARDRSLLWSAMASTFVLMLLNWGIEAVKWRKLVQGLEALSLRRAVAAVYAGTSIGLITPNRVGEFVGRVLFLAPAHRIPGSFATAVGSIAQFVVTVVTGTIAFSLMRAGTWPLDGSPWTSIAGMVLCSVVAGGSLVLYFNPDLLRTLIARLPVVRRWERHAAVLEGFSLKELFAVLMLSLARYVVFTVQFLIVLAAVAGIAPGEALLAVPVAFLISTLIPTVMLTELGVRGSVAVALISPQVSQDQGVFLASTLLWLINIGVPALVGSFILLLARIRSAGE
ncbi:MAG: flippase-like domain-containing protein [Flavobacteriales bacterium]|nr:flippase-like domain-containing protein [Flavobacteriales bacterium]